MIGETPTSFRDFNFALAPNVETFAMPRMMLLKELQAIVEDYQGQQQCEVKDRRCDKKGMVRDLP